MNRTSVSAVHDQLLGSLSGAPAAPAFLVDPDFFLNPINNQNFSLGDPPIAFILGFENNGSNGYNDVTAEIVGTPSLISVFGSPENIGSVGAANAGFFQNIGAQPLSTLGTETITVRMTGTLNGTSDVYGHEVTFDVTVS